MGEPRVAAETFAFGRFRVGARAAVLVGLLESAVDIVGVQDGQIE